MGIRELTQRVSVMKIFSKTHRPLKQILTGPKEKAVLVVGMMGNPMDFLREDGICPIKSLSTMGDSHEL